MWHASKDVNSNFSLHLFYKKIDDLFSFRTDIVYYFDCMITDNGSIEKQSKINLMGISLKLNMIFLFYYVMIFLSSFQVRLK